jgi:hypothetical protein
VQPVAVEESPSGFICADSFGFLGSRRQMLDQRQLSSRVQLSKVYLIHEGADEKDATAGAAEKIFRRERIGQMVGIEAVALVGDGKDKVSSGVFESHVDHPRRIVLVAVQNGVYRSLAHRHHHVEALVFIQAGFGGDPFGSRFHFAYAFHGGV